MPKARGPLALSAALVLGVSVTLSAATRIENQPFGQTAEGKPVAIFTLSREGAPTVRITNYGGIVVSIVAPDRTGKMADVALGFSKLDGYLADASFQGALVGRYGNRIATGQFALDGKSYTLVRNNGENHLHGGTKGFNKKVWDASVVKGASGESLELTYTSADGEEGYPGTLKATVLYSLTAERGLEIRYSATTDKTTVVNLTNHTYFNLAGEGSGDVLAQEIQMEADQFTPVDKTLIPTGELRNVKGTPLDLTKPVAIGAHIDDADEQIGVGSGYDHNFVLRGRSEGPWLGARVVDPKSGRVLEVLTTEPGIQFYTGNFLDGSLIGKAGKPYAKRNGFCLEAQHFPDSPNKPSFPSVVLKPGATYRQTTVYRFTTAP
jgi:aldose 1-epimerase